jgi:hypothetical protein
MNSMTPGTNWNMTIRTPKAIKKVAIRLKPSPSPPPPDARACVPVITSDKMVAYTVFMTFSFHGTCVAAVLIEGLVSITLYSR